MIRTLCLLLLLASCAKSAPTQSPNNAPNQPKTEAEASKPRDNTAAAKEDSAPKPTAAMDMNPSADPLASSSAEITAGKMEIKGDIPPEEVVRVIKKSIPGIKFCYDEARTKNPTLSGKMKVSFVISSSGDAQNVKTKEGVSSDLDECVAKKFAQLKFPPPTKGTAEVSYPLVFSDN